MKAIGYVRCSTDRQDLGLEAQEAAIRAAAARLGLEVGAVFVEADVCGAKGADHAGASRLEPDPREEAIVQAVAELRASGLTLRAIVLELERRQVFGRAMTPLGLSTVAGIVKRLAGEAA